MRNIRVISDELTRNQLANPFPKGSIKERLVKRKSVNKVNNFASVDFGDLYGKAVAIDKNKTF